MGVVASLDRVIEALELQLEQLRATRDAIQQRRAERATKEPPPIPLADPSGGAVRPRDPEGRHRCAAAFRGSCGGEHLVEPCDDCREVFVRCRAHGGQHAATLLLAQHRRAVHPRAALG